MAIGNQAHGDVHPPGHEPTVGHALQHLADATQGVIRNQLDLARLEAKQAAGVSFRGATALVLGGVLLLVAWVALSVAAYTALLRSVAPWASLCIVAAVNAVLGGGAVAYGMTRLRELRGT